MCRLAQPSSADTFVTPEQCERSSMCRLTQLASADLEVFSLSQSRPSLDDVYLQATGRTLMDAELAVAGQRDPKLERRQSMR